MMPPCEGQAGLLADPGGEGQAARPDGQRTTLPGRPRPGRCLCGDEATGKAQGGQIGPPP
ncbi:MAG: hypothetical protein LBP92_12185 [Deltaproteobacteria bacterium]|nr:hypothetical protein [Deltaproteobacteria bacterium]